MKLSTKLTILILSIVVITGAILSILIYRADLRFLEEEISHNLENIAFHTMDKIDRNLFERFSDIQIMANDPIISSKNSTPKQITERLIEFRNTYKTYNSLSFFDLNRIRIADTSGLHLGKQHKMVRYWKDVLEGKISAATDIRMAEELKIPIIYFAAPVLDASGKAFGVVVSRMPISKLYEMTKTIVPQAHDHGKLEIDLIDKEGLLIYSNTNKKGILKDNLSDWGAVKASMAKGAAIGSLTIYDPILKEEDFFVYVREQGYLNFTGNDWILLLHTPTKSAFSPAVELRNKIVFMLIPIGFLAIILTLFLSRTFTSPINKLKEAAVKIGAGKFDTKIEVKSRDEIGAVASAFNKMVENLKKTTASRDEFNAVNQQLKANEQQLKATNQQLAANEQDLKAVNQQLRANEQQLKATNQQLIANEQNLKAFNQQLKANEQQLKAINQQLKANEQNLKAVNQQLKSREQELKASEQVLKTKIEDMENLNRVMMEREFRVIDIKKEVNELCQKLKEPDRYTEGLE